MHSEKTVKRSYRAPLRRKQAALTRSQILRAAESVFSSKGFAGTRIEEVAQVAGVSVPTVYKTFKTKSALLLAMVQAAMAETDSEAPLEELPWWQEQIATANAGDQLRLIARNARAIYERAGALLEVARNASAADADVEAVWRVIKLQRRHRSQLTAESLRAKGALRPSITTASVEDTLLLFTAPELYTLFLDREGTTPEDYESWLAQVLSNALLP